MKIEIDIDPKDLTKSLKETLDSLPPEKRVELARSTMEGWLRSPYDIERVVKEREVIDLLISERGYDAPKTEKDARSSWKFQDHMSKFKSTKEEMVQTITKEIVNAYAAEIKKVVENDPKIQAMKDEVAQAIRESFPKVVHEAMVQWMASSMATMFQTTMGIPQSMEALSKFSGEMTNRLMRVEGALSNRMS